MSETAWLDIYRRVAVDAADENATRALSNTPVFREPASWLDAMRGAWAGETWMGRITSEDIFGNALYRSYVEASYPMDSDDPPWSPAQGNYTGVEQFTHELAHARNRQEFELRKLNILDRQDRIATAGSRNGVLHQMVAHLLDPSIVIGYGIGKAALGLPARVVGARVAAVEAGLVGTQQAMMAARYEDRTAGDAVRSAAYAGVFGFVLGAGLSKVMYGRQGKGWSGGALDFGTRQRAAAARQTTMNIVDETDPATVERTDRVGRAYEPAVTKLNEAVTKQEGAVGRMAAALGIKAEDATDDVLAKLYETGDKATRQRVTRLRNARVRGGEVARERDLMNLERASAEFAKDSDTWKSNTFAALMSGRKGIAAMMLPRARVVAESPFELGIKGLPDSVNKTLSDAFEGLRNGARLLTRSHGMDTAMSKMPGANVEDMHSRAITILYREDEQLRTAAIHSIRNMNYPHAMYTPTVRSITGVFRWTANKALELPHVISGARIGKPNVLGSAEDQLETWLQRVAQEARVEGRTLKLDHIEAPKEVKALFEWRQKQYQEIGGKLRKHNLMYIQRSLNEEHAKLTATLDLERANMQSLPIGSRPWDDAFDKWDNANRRLAEIDEQAEAYKAADDPLYQPISLMSHKVRADRAGFVKAAMEHFWKNPRTVARAPRSAPGPTRDLPVVMTPMMVEGRAHALWYATVYRADFAGRPVGRAEFIRKLEAVIEDIAPKRAERWAAYRNQTANESIRRPTATTVEEATVDALILRVEGIKRAEALSRADAGGRYLQSEMFETGRLDPVLFRPFIEDRPTIQFKAYLEREVRRVYAAERIGDPDAINPMAAAEMRVRGIEQMAEQDRLLLDILNTKTLDELTPPEIRKILAEMRKGSMDTRGAVYQALESFVETMPKKLRTGGVADPVAWIGQKTFGDDPDVAEFIRLSRLTSKAEKVSDPKTWTAAESAAYASGDWRKFSELRGYTPEEIAQYVEFREVSARLRAKFDEDTVMWFGGIVSGDLKVPPELIAEMISESVYKGLNEIRAMQAFEVPVEAIAELRERIKNYDMLRRQMMGEVLFENSHAFIDGMNKAAGIAANISTAADLGMAGYSVSIDLGQMFAYYGMGPWKLAKFAKQVFSDPGMRAALADPKVRHELGVAGEVLRGARLRAIQGADSTFGNQGGFMASGNYWSDLGRWAGNFYAEAASNIMSASLLNAITDLTQLLAAPLATSRIIQSIGRVANGIGDTMDANILRRLGMEPEMAARVWAQYKDGQKGVWMLGKNTDELARDGSMILPEFSTWRDPELAEQVMSMISGDIRVATLHPGIAANRVWTGMGGALHAVSRLYYLFTRWAMVSSANIYGKNIEDGTYQHTATALMYSTIIQAVVNAAKEPDFVTQSLEERLKNALVMGGGFGYLGVMNERLERISGHQLGLRPLMGIDTFAHDPESLQFRAAAFGPVTGKAGAMIGAVSENRYGSLGRLLLPYQNWWLWAGAVRVTADKLDFDEE